MGQRHGYESASQRRRGRKMSRKIFEALKLLQPDWNSYDASAIDREAIRAAELIALALAHSPQIAPTATGGVQLEWHTEGIDLEIEIKKDLSIEVFYEEAN